MSGVKEGDIGRYNILALIHKATLADTMKRDFSRERRERQAIEEICRGKEGIRPKRIENSYFEQKSASYA